VFAETPALSGSSGQWLDADLIVYGASEALAAPKISFGSLNRSMAQEELDLL
jgi:hypothetical protein